MKLVTNYSGFIIKDFRMLSRFFLVSAFIFLYSIQANGNYNARDFDVYYGDFNSDGIQDIYLDSKTQIVLIYGDIITPIQTKIAQSTLLVGPLFTAIEVEIDIAAISSGYEYIGDDFGIEVGDFNGDQLADVLLDGMGSENYIVSNASGSVSLASISAILTEVNFQHSDLYGTPIAETNSEGQVLWQRSSIPYGEATNTIESVDYTGHYRDEGGLIYMGARYYDPSLFRFISVDPVGVQAEAPASFNRYAYANNNPISYHDPDGRWAEDLFIGIPSMVMGSVAAVNSAMAGDWAGAGIYSLAVGADILATITPGVPGGASLGVIAGRTATNVASSGSKVTKSADKWSRAPKSIQDQMTLKAAQEGQGNVIIKSLNDPKFKGMEKMELKVKSNNGSDSVVHYVRDPKTQNLMDFKFKKHSTDGLNKVERVPDPRIGTY